MYVALGKIVICNIGEVLSAVENVYAQTILAKRSRNVPLVISELVYFTEVFVVGEMIMV